VTLVTTHACAAKPNPLQDESWVGRSGKQTVELIIKGPRWNISKWLKASPPIRHGRHLTPVASPLRTTRKKQQKWKSLSQTRHTSITYPQFYYTLTVRGGVTRGFMVHISATTRDITRFIVAFQRLSSLLDDEFLMNSLDSVKRTQIFGRKTWGYQATWKV
jgi:hypothetical protein